MATSSSDGPSTVHSTLLACGTNPVTPSLAALGALEATVRCANEWRATMLGTLAVPRHALILACEGHKIQIAFAVAVQDTLSPFSTGSLQKPIRLGVCRGGPARLVPIDSLMRSHDNVVFHTEGRTPAPTFCSWGGWVSLFYGWILSIGPLTAGCSDGFPVAQSKHHSGRSRRSGRGVASETRSARQIGEA